MPRSFPRSLISALFLLTLAGCVENRAQIWQQGAGLLNAAVSGQEELSREEIGLGLKDALKVGSANVVSQLGRTDGIYRDPAIHIPLPDQLEKVQTVLEGLGLAYMLDNLELKLNRAAEVAAPRARAIFWQAIREMTFTDIMAIYEGPDDAATRYFQSKMSPDLAREMRPIVSASLSEVGAIKAYEAAMGEYRSIPFVPDVKANLSSYVVDRGMAGLFYYLAAEEKAIRTNPAKRTTDLLRRVFGPS